MKKTTNSIFPFKKTKSETEKGVSLIELLVVIAIFSFIAILATRGIFLSLRGSKKSESVALVRENLDYSFAVMERNLRNAELATCEPSPLIQVNYEDKFGNLAYFSCEDVGSDGYISSNSARLTSDQVEIAACQITCVAGISGVPPSVSIEISGEDKNAQGVEGASVNLSTKVFLRTY
jgi:prepilin-type N-terminal cleavage/methylation domain-containing protein